MERQPKLVDDLKEVLIGGKLKQKTKFGRLVPLIVDEELIRCLVCDKDIFSWKVRVMLRINPKFISHKLSLNFEARPVAQKWRKFGDDKRRPIK